MGEAIKNGCKNNDRENMPSPGNVISVLDYVASLLEEKPAKPPKPKCWK